MKALKILLVILVVLVVLAGGALLLLNRYVQSPSFKETALLAVQTAGGAKMQVTDLDVSLWRGVSLRGIAVANPPGYAGNLVQADAFVLRYRLLPLFQRRLEITQLELQKPVIALMRNADGAWNFEQLGGGAGDSGGGGSIHQAGLDISLQRLALTRGTVVVLGPDNKELLKLQDLQLTSNVELAGGALHGRGQSGIGEINVANALFVRDVAALVSIAPDAVKLAPLTATLAGGKVGGELVLATAAPAGYTVNLEVTDADVTELFQDAGARPVISGKLQATAELAGTGGLETITGRGHADILDGHLMEVPLLDLLATLLQVPELRGLKFSECRVEFTVANNVLNTPVIRLTADRVQITGQGRVALTDYALDHTFTLAVQKELLDKVPKELRMIFGERADGYLTLDFKVTGPYDSPQTDLKKRLVKGATDQLIQKGLQQLFK